jgi:hypothetical protein
MTQLIVYGKEVGHLNSNMGIMHQETSVSLFRQAKIQSLGPTKKMVLFLLA